MVAMRKTVVLAICVLILLCMVTVPATAELDGWQYQREITIHENSGQTLADYQILFDLSGSNFPLNAKSDGADFRFTDSSGKELSYWIEEFNPSTKTGKIWVKVPSIPASGETKITMYYGNLGASSQSNGDATFEFFDDFDDNSIDTIKWPIASGIVKEQNKRMEVGIIRDSSSDWVNSPKRTVPEIIEARVHMGSASGWDGLVDPGSLGILVNLLPP